MQAITLPSGKTACTTSLVLDGNTGKTNIIVDEVQEPVVICLRKTDHEAESSDLVTAKGD